MDKMENQKSVRVKVVNLFDKNVACAIAHISPKRSNASMNEK